MIRLALRPPVPPTPAQDRLDAAEARFADALARLDAALSERRMDGGGRPVPARPNVVAPNQGVTGR